jgi:hypothetical protein
MHIFTQFVCTANAVAIKLRQESHGCPFDRMDQRNKSHSLSERVNFADNYGVMKIMHEPKRGREIGKESGEL